MVLILLVLKAESVQRWVGALARTYRLEFKALSVGGR